MSRVHQKSLYTPKSDSRLQFQYLKGSEIQWPQFRKHQVRIFVDPPKPQNIENELFMYNTSIEKFSIGKRFTNEPCSHFSFRCNYYPPEFQFNLHYNKQIRQICEKDRHLLNDFVQKKLIFPTRIEKRQTIGFGFVSTRFIKKYEPIGFYGCIVMSIHEVQINNLNHVALQFVTGTNIHNSYCLVPYNGMWSQGPIFNGCKSKQEATIQPQIVFTPQYGIQVVFRARVNILKNTSLVWYYNGFEKLYDVENFKQTNQFKLINPQYISNKCELIDCIEEANKNTKVEIIKNKNRQTLKLIREKKRGRKHKIKNIDVFWNKNPNKNLQLKTIVKLKNKKLKKRKFK